MNKILRYSFLLLFAIVSSVGFAQTEIDFTKQTITASSDGFTLTVGDFSFVAAKNGGATTPTQNGNAKDLRLYAKNTFKVSGPSMSSMTFTISKQGKRRWADVTSSTGDINIDVDGGTLTWTSSTAVSEVTFTVGDKATHGSDGATKAGQFDIDKVSITTGGDTSTPSPTVEKPTISGTTPFTDKTTVTITVPTGTSVYYTTDGSTPDDNGDQYTDPFELTATTTVKAVAYNAEGTAHSDVVSQEFVKQGNVTTTGAGTLENPYTVADVIALQNANAAPADSVYVKGIVSTAATSISSYGDANYYLSDDGTTNSQIEAYNSYYYKKAKYTDVSQLPKVGDVVVLYGKITKFGNTIELARGNYLFSIKSNGSDTPTVNAESLPYEESFSSDQGKFTINDVTVPENASAVWKIDAGQHYMKASGYVNRKNKNAESWLISPLIDLTKASDPRLAYMQAGKFFGTMADEASVWVKAENDADWTQLTVPTYMTGNDWNFVNDTISLKPFVGKNVQIAFKYVSTEAAAGTWEIKNVSVKDYSSETPAETVTAENIAAFNAADNNATVALTLKDAQVTYSWTSNNGNTSIYLRDASGTTSIRNQKADAVQLGYKTGDVLNGTIVLTRSEYNKAIQGIINDKTDASTVTVTTGEAPVAKEITYTDAKENESNLVVLKNVDIVSDASAAKTRATERFYIGTGSDRLQVYNGFHLAGYTVAAATGVDVKGIITRYNNTYEIQPVEVPTESTATGINGVKSTEDNANAPIYNLAGQRVSKNYKGVVIQNGKKRINK